MKSPVLFLVFNRPQTTRQVFEAIRAAQPPKLYVAADGPRESRIGEAERCAEVRRIATSVDWPCQVETLFRDTNLGCKMGVSSGITWFFSHESEGIILEDDVLPVSTFFPFCDELLARYRDDDRIIAVSGCNLISGIFTPAASYFFSRYNSIWGWATWRRAWAHYDVHMAKWPAWRDSNQLGKMAGANWPFESYWRSILNAVHDGKIDTWDYQWSFASWVVNGLAIQPAINQTQNLGFGIDATHTTAHIPDFIRNSRAQPLTFPLIHPDIVERQPDADASIDSDVLGINLRSTVKKRLMSAPGFKHVKSLVRAIRQY